MFFNLKSLFFTICTLWSSFVVYNLSNVVNDVGIFNNSQQSESNFDVNNKVEGSDKNIKKESHIMTLIIPKINVNNRIYSKESVENDIDKNVQLMKASDMPSLVNGNVILGGHSGTGKLAYFKRLNELVNGDTIILNYNGKDYLYKIVNSYLEYFLESRCFPKSRAMLKSILRELGLDSYDPLAIIEKTQGRMAEDKQWIHLIYYRPTENGNIY